MEGRERVVGADAERVVGADAHIGPLGNHRICRGVSRFGGAFCRADVGIGPYGFTVTVRIKGRNRHSGK